MISKVLLGDLEGAETRRLRTALKRSYRPQTQRWFLYSGSRLPDMLCNLSDLQDHLLEYGANNSPNPSRMMEMLPPEGRFACGRLLSGGREQNAVVGRGRPCLRWGSQWNNPCRGARCLFLSPG